MTPKELEVLAGIDLDDYYVEKIIDREEKGRNPNNWKFRVRWAGYDSDVILECVQRPCWFRRS